MQSIVLTLRRSVAHKESKAGRNIAHDKCNIGTDRSNVKVKRSRYTVIHGTINRHAADDNVRHNTELFNMMA